MKRLLIFFLLVSCEHPRQNITSNNIAPEEKNALDLRMQTFMSNFGYNDSLLLPLSVDSSFNFRIAIQCKDRVFYKLLYVEKDIIKEVGFDVMCFKNRCKIPYKKKKILKLGDERISTFYNDVKSIQYKDTLISSFLLSKIFKYEKGINLMDAGGSFRIIRIDKNNRMRYFNLYGYLYNDKEIKDFYKALMRQSKKDNCECLENLHWSLSE